MRYMPFRRCLPGLLAVLTIQFGWTPACHGASPPWFWRHTWPHLRHTGKPTALHISSSRGRSPPQRPTEPSQAYHRATAGCQRPHPSHAPPCPTHTPAHPLPQTHGLHLLPTPPVYHPILPQHAQVAMLPLPTTPTHTLPTPTGRTAANCRNRTARTPAGAAHHRRANTTTASPPASCGTWRRDATRRGRRARPFSWTTDRTTCRVDAADTLFFCVLRLTRLPPRACGACLARTWAPYPPACPPTRITLRATGG